MNRKDLPIERTASLIIILGGVLFLLHFFLTPLVLTLLPFLLALGMAYIARPLALRLHRLTKLPVGVLSVILVFLFLAICFTGLFFAAKQAIFELLALGERLSGNNTPLPDLLTAVEDWWAGILIRMPFLAELGLSPEMGMTELMGEWLHTAGARLGEWALSSAGRIASALPGVLVFLLVTLACAFYFALDLDGIGRSISTMLPGKAGVVFARIKDGLTQTVNGYLRAYIILLLFTFMMLLFGFLLLRIPYAILLSALFALLDLLPVIGVGSLLIPWAVFAFLTGNAPLGIGLLALYAVIAVVRQFLEPKLLGDHLGLHPLAALLATYAGLQLFGFWGLLLLPGACVVVYQAVKNKKVEKKDKRRQPE